MTTSDITILLVDDESAHLQTLARLFTKKGYQVLSAEDGEKAFELIKKHPVNIVVTDLMMPRTDGLELLQLIRTLKPDIEVILMSAFGTVELAVKGIKEGAYDFITKPIKRDAILKSVRQATERQALIAENKALKAKLADLKNAAGRYQSSIIGQSEGLRKVMDLVHQVARSDVTVLLTGESGTGKELFARMIAECSERANKPFVALNCAALPESILESELFGYEKGAFTGATQRKTGRFEAASGGILFLDEIAELAPHLQVKLLRVLQEQTFERLGSNIPIQTDIRIIAATNRDLEEEMREGRFRDDLYYRLNVVNLDIPPLRRRREDIPLLSEHFLVRYNQKNNRQIHSFSQQALHILMHYHWPGNVRELENIIERAVVLDRDDLIDLNDLPEHLTPDSKDNKRTIQVELGTTLEDIEHLVMTETLKMTGGNKKLAAKILGIATRTIYRKL